MKAMTFKKVKEMGGEYMRLQFAVAQISLKVENPVPHLSLAQIQAFRETLEGRYRGYYYNLIKIGNTFNDLLRDCIAQNDKIAKGVFMILTSSIKSLDADLIAKASKECANIDFSIIPPRDADVWRDLIVREVIKPLMILESDKAAIRLLQSLYAPKDISFDGLTTGAFTREQILNGVKECAKTEPDTISRVEKVCGTFDPWTASSYDISREDVSPEERHFKARDITSADILLNWVDLAAKIRERKFPSAVIREHLPPTQTDKKGA